MMACSTSALRSLKRAARANQKCKQFSSTSASIRTVEFSKITGNAGGSRHYHVLKKESKINDISAFTSRKVR